MDLESQKSEERPLKRKVGNMHCFFYQPNGLPLIMIGPDWGKSIMLHLVTIGVLFVNVFMMTIMYEYKEPFWKFLISIILVICGLFSVSYTFLANPGIPTELFTRQDHEIEDRALAEQAAMRQHNRADLKWCETCQIMRDEKLIQHCEDCNVCVKGLDHHCPVYGKCIGEGNYKTFILTLVFCCASLMITMLLNMNDNKKMNKFMGVE